ncbi:MAG: GMP synthase [Cyclobacteriaceae bacterium]
MQASPIKVAILDLNNNHPNQGLRCIKELVENHPEPLEWQIFDVRHKLEIPDTSFDIYISSGGPDSPLENGVGEQNFLNLIDELWKLNQSGLEPKKQFFFVCHSFQIACRYFKIGQIKPRRSKSFGIFPVHKEVAGLTDPLLKHLPDPFYALDFRDWQIIKPNKNRLEELGAKVLCKEKIRPHIRLERAIMGIRFSEDWVGFQFHPEADPEGIATYFQTEEKKASVVEVYGEQKFDAIIEGLEDPNQIPLTYNTIIPMFITDAIKRVRKAEPAIS